MQVTDHFENEYHGKTYEIDNLWFVVTNVNDEVLFTGGYGVNERLSDDAEQVLAEVVENYRISKLL